MQEYNYFDLLILSPFPKLPTRDEIESAAAKWEVEAKKRSNSSGTPKAQKDELLEMLRVLPPKLKAFAADTKEQTNQKNQYRDQHCAQLQVIADYMKKYSGNTIREATLRRIARQAGLASDDVKKVFKSTGFEVLPSTAYAGVLPDAKNLASFTENVEQLKKSMNRGVGHIPVGIGEVRDLYQYAQLLLEYEGMEAISMNDWKAIQAKFNELSVKHATGTEPYNFYRNIESLAKTSLFNNENNKKKYDNYVKLQESGLADALESIAGLPEPVRTDPIFARNWVSSIHTQLSIEEEEAYEIYNVMCRIPPEERLEKEDVQVRTLCACGHLNTHESLRAAEAATCVVCGKKLYIPCPSCGAAVRNSADTCSNCGYYLPGEQIFRQAMQSCQDAIRRKQIQEARKQMNRARDYQPRKDAVKELEGQLEQLEKSIGSALSKIDQLILTGKLNEATRELQALRVANPGLNVDVQQRNIQQRQQQIASQKKELDLKMQHAVGKTPREQVQICMDILSQDESYESARQMLRNPALAPLPVSGVRLTKDDDARTVTVAWEANPQNTYVTYTLVRLNTAHVPASPQEGTLLIKGLEATSYQDTSAQPGTVLYYAVFAVRKNVEQWSKAAMFAKPVVLMPGCKSFNYTVSDMDCVLQWEMPRGCAGVMLERSMGQTGKWETVQPLTSLRTYTDRGLQLSINYEYRCTAIWNIDGQRYPSSQVKTLTFSLQKRPNPVTLSISQQQEGELYTVTWKTDNQGQMEIWSLPTEMNLREGTLLEPETLKKAGSRLWQGVAAARTATFTVGPNQEVRLISTCVYGSQVVTGQPVLLSTMSPLPVQWDQMRLADDQLSLTMGAVPGLMEVRVFLDQEEPDRSTILTAKPYISVKYPQGANEPQTIMIPNLPQRELWVSLAGILKNGNVTRASGHLVNNLPKQAVTYDVSWKRTGMIRSSISGLEVTVRVRDRNTPHAVLVYNRANPTIPLRENEFSPDRMTVLVEIPEGTGRETRVKAREADVRSLPQGARVKLMLASDVQSGYRVPVPENAMMLVKP